MVLPSLRVSCFSSTLYPVHRDSVRPSRGSYSGSNRIGPVGFGEVEIPIHRASARPLFAGSEFRYSCSYLIYYEAKNPPR